MTLGSEVANGSSHCRTESFDAPARTRTGTSALHRRGEQFLNLGFDHGDLDGSDVAGSDLPPAVDHEGDGKAEDSSILPSQCGGASGDGVIHFVLLLEVAHGLVLVVHGDADDLQPRGGIMILHLDEERNLLL